MHGVLGLKEFVCDIPLAEQSWTLKAGTTRCMHGVRVLLLLLLLFLFLANITLV